LLKSRAEPPKVDSSLKRHTALIKRIRQSLAIENHDQIRKEIEMLSLEKYLDEIVSAVTEGLARCKTEKDVWSAVEARIRRHCCNVALIVSAGHFCIASPLSKGVHACARGLFINCN
jgi:hypothetical protein